MTSQNQIKSFRANNRQINEILGNAPGPKTKQVQVRGVNPEFLTCDYLTVYDIFAFYGRLVTPLRAWDGTANNVGITFYRCGINSGLYSSSPNNICVAINGTPTGCFTPTGFAASTIYGPSGTIDFRGSTLTNFTMTPNPDSYAIIGTKVQTIGATTISALIIPLTCTTTTAAWELKTKIIYTDVTDDPLAIDNGTYTFRIRAWRSGPLAIGRQYDITRYHTPAFIGIRISAVVVGDNVEIQVTGVGVPAALTINWLAKSDIIRIETP